MQTTAIRTVANSLPQNEVILLTFLISKRYIPYTDLRKIHRFSVSLQEKHIDFTAPQADGKPLLQARSYKPDE